MKTRDVRKTGMLIASSIAISVKALTFTLMAPQTIHAIQIQADASTKYNVSGGSDIYQLRQYLSAGSWGGAIISQTQTVSKLEHLNIKGTRAINIHGSYITNGEFIASARLNNSLNDINQLGLTPFLVTATGNAPVHINKNQLSDWTQSSYYQYVQYCKAFIQYAHDHVGDKPTLYDNFTDGDFTTDVNWNRWNEESGYPWVMTNSCLVMPLGTLGFNPSIRLDFTAVTNPAPTHISFNIRNPQAIINHQPMCISLVESSTGNGYNLFGSPMLTSFGACSGFGYSIHSDPTSDPVQGAGTAGEALGRYNSIDWETISITFDPATQTVTLTRNGSEAIHFSGNQNLSSIDRIEFTQRKNQIAWEIDDVCIWGGSRQTIPEIIMEVGNEPEAIASTTTYPWWTEYHDGTVPTSGSSILFQDYLKLYKAWDSATEQMEMQIQRPLKIGGPATTVFTFYYGAFNWMTNFPARVLAYEHRIDFLSYHIYGNNTVLTDRTSPNMVYPGLEDQISELRDNLDQLGLMKTDIHITEWGPSARVDNIIWEDDAHTIPGDGVISGDQTGAAWSACFILNLLQNCADKALLLGLRDRPVVGTTATPRLTYPSYLNLDGIYYTPIGNLAQMLQLIPDHRVTTTALGGNLGSLASVDLEGERAGILVYNYNWDFENKQENATNETVNVQFTNLPDWGTVNVTRYLIDEDTSNAAQFWKEDPTISFTQSMINASDVMHPTNTMSFSTNILNGTLNIGSVTLKPSSVILWVIENNG